MWNAKQSIVLSKICVIASIAVLLLFLLIAPWTVKWLLSYSLVARQANTNLFLATIYCGGIFLFFMLYSLYVLLFNIEKKKVFINNNILYLRRISWCCFAGGVIALTSSLYFFSWIFIAIAAGFVGLIVRVVKNVIEEAVVLKEENDFTI